MPTLDCDALNELLKSDIHRCMTAFRAKLPNETFYVFVLYTDSDAITVSAYANTIEAFKKTLKDDSESAWTKWAPDEWEFLDDENFMEASQGIVGDYEGFDGPDFEARKLAVYGAFATALSQLRNEGLFDPQMALFVNNSDPSEEELAVMRRIIREVNPEPLATELSQAFGEGLNEDESEDESHAEDDFDDREEEEEPQEYETQEFVFYLGDRKLGSFFMPVFGAATPEPIVRRLITPPTKTNVCGHLALLWVEDTDSGGKTMIWNADTPKEVIEAERLFNAAHGRDDDADSVEFTPVERSPEVVQLLQAVLDDFENDVPLLAYADWLTARGSTQGEFIRVDLQIENTDPDDPQYRTLNDRWGELLAEHAESWYQPLTALNLFPYEHSFWMDRGVICEVEINRLELLTEHAAELFNAVPLLRKLAFDCEDLDVSDLVQIPQMSQIMSLDLSYLDVTPDQLSALLNSPHLHRLTELDLGGNSDGTELVRAIVASPVWRQLRLLKLSNCGVDDEGVELIADCDEPLALRTLELDANEFSKQGLAALGRSTGLAHLTSLYLGDTELSADGIVELARASWIPQLESLSLKSCKINESIASALSKWPVKSLRHLYLSSCEFDDAGLITLLQSDLLANIEELELSHNNLTDEGIVSLAQSPTVAKMKSLELSSNPFGTDGVVAIARSPFLSALTTLKLDAIDLGSAGVQALAASPYLQKIKWLWIGEDNGLTESDREPLIARFGESAVGV